MSCIDNKKVIWATDTLKGDAQRWWVQEIELGMPTIWANFIVRFNKRYFIKAFQDRKQRELINLKQESMTVHEYLTKYISLLRVAGALVPNEMDKARRFQMGLQDNIRGRVALHQLEESARVLEVATTAEQEMELT